MQSGSSTRWMGALAALGLFGSGAWAQSNAGISAQQAGSVSQVPATSGGTAGTGVSAQQPGTGTATPPVNVDTSLSAQNPTGPDGVQGTADDGSGPAPGDPGAAGPAGKDGVLGTADDRPPGTGAGAVTTVDVTPGTAPPTTPAGADGIAGTADAATTAIPPGGVIAPSIGAAGPSAGGDTGLGEDTNFGNGGPGGVDSRGGTDARPRAGDFDSADGVGATGADFDSRDGVSSTPGR